MRGPDVRIFLAVALLATASGCASTLAPRGYLPRAGEAGDAKGGWIVAEVGPSEPTRQVAGELIAVERDTVFVLTESGLEALPAGRFHSAQVATYESEWGGPAAWTLLGTLSTASHGWVLVATAPAWIIVGTICTATASHAGIYRYPGMSLSEFAPFARFPQGLPSRVRSSGLPGGWPAVVPPARPKR